MCDSLEVILPEFSLFYCIVLRNGYEVWVGLDIFLILYIVTIVIVSVHYFLLFFYIVYKKGMFKFGSGIKGSYIHL